MKTAFLEAGKIVNTHGVNGDLKIDSWCDTPEIFCSLTRLYLSENGEYRLLTPRKSSPFKGMALCHFDGIDSMEEANRLKNRTVYARREDIPLPEGAVFTADLLGLPVIDADSGKVYGTIADVQKGAASELYEIKTEKGTVLFPAVREFVSKIDTENGVYIRPIGGFFDAL